QRGDGQRGSQHGANDDNGGNRVGHRHQRGVQGRGDVPDHVVANVDGQHEDDQVVDTVGNQIHVAILPLAVVAHDLTACAHQARGDDVVFEVEVELAVLVDDQLEEIQQVAGIEGRGIGRHHGGQVAVADNGYAMLHDHLIGNSQRAVATLCRG